MASYHAILKILLCGPLYIILDYAALFCVKRTRKRKRVAPSDDVEDVDIPGPAMVDTPGGKMMMATGHLNTKDTTPLPNAVVDNQY